jgi:hypothetical protein
MLEGSLDLKSKFEQAGGSKKVTWTVLPPPPATRNPLSPAIYTCTRRQTRVVRAHKHNPARTCGMMVALPFGTNSEHAAPRLLVGMCAQVPRVPRVL